MGRYPTNDPSNSATRWQHHIFFKIFGELGRYPTNDPSNLAARGQHNRRLKFSKRWVGTPRMTHQTWPPGGSTIDFSKILESWVGTPQTTPRITHFSQDTNLSCIKCRSVSLTLRGAVVKWLASWIVYWMTRVRVPLRVSEKNYRNLFKIFLIPFNNFQKHFQQETQTTNI